MNIKKEAAKTATSTFEVGKKYLAWYNKSSSITIIKRTSKTVTFVNVVNGETSLFGATTKRIKIVNSSEYFADGIFCYQADQSVESEIELFQETDQSVKSEIELFQEADRAACAAPCGQPLSEAKISVRLCFNEANICLGGLALEIYSKKFSFDGGYYASEDVQIYPSQDVQGKTWPTINKERVKVWYEALKAKNA